MVSFSYVWSAMIAGVTAIWYRMSSDGGTADGTLIIPINVWHLWIKFEIFVECPCTPWHRSLQVIKSILIYISETGVAIINRLLVKLLSFYKMAKFSWVMLFFETINEFARPFKILNINASSYLIDHVIKRIHLIAHCAVRTQGIIALCAFLPSLLALLKWSFFYFRPCKLHVIKFIYYMA